MTVGMFMIIIDKDERRRELYGKAGAFRPKSYGVEYRTPSNEWLKNDSRASVVYTLSNVAVRIMKSENRELFSQWIKSSTEEVINTGDFDKAYYLLSQLAKRDWITPSVQRTIKREYDARTGVGVTEKAKPAKAKTKASSYKDIFADASLSAESVWRNPSVNSVTRTDT
jgi:hypothetical protein